MSTSALTTMGVSCVVACLLLGCTPPPTGGGEPVVTIPSVASGEQEFRPLVSPCGCFVATVKKLTAKTLAVEVKIHKTGIERQVMETGSRANLTWVQPPGGNVLIVNYLGADDQEQCIAYFPPADKKVQLDAQPLAEFERDTKGSFLRVDARAIHQPADASTVVVALEAFDGHSIARQSFTVRLADGSIVNRNERVLKSK